MAEFISTESLTLNSGGIVTYNETIRNACDCISHRKGSGTVTLHGKKDYVVAFSANLAAATADTTVTLALTINGEVVAGTTMAATPSAANVANNVSTFCHIKVPCSCCYNIAVENTSDSAVTVTEANLIVVRED